MAKYKYSGFKSKAHPKGDFRTEKPELIKVRNGFRWMKGCEQFIAGRWEGFVSFPGGVYKSKAEALKRKPKW